MAQIIDGKMISAKLVEEVMADTVEFKEKHGRAPGLAVIQVGANPASEIYVRNKEKRCIDAGMYSVVYKLPEETTMEELLANIDKLNNDDKVDGILVQLPLPAHLDEKAVIAAISPEKDVDGFHIANAGKLLVGEKGLVSCTPKGIITLLKSTGEKLAGKHAVVIGRSNIVGKPVAVLLLNENCTVTVCHSRTQNLSEITRQADILVCAIGRANFVTGDMIKDGAIVIDVGINRVDGKVVGDVKFDEAEKKASYITPVPGGVGPMTIAELLRNTIIAAKNHV